MLIAAQAKRGMIAPATPDPAIAVAKAAADEEIKTAESTVAAIESNCIELQAKIDHEKLEAALREQERGQFQTLVNVAEQRLEEYRNQLSKDERARYDLERELVSSKSELSLLNTTQVSLTKPKPHVLEHLPTPMARTVFGSEIHFRLLGHRLAYVPFEEMKVAFNADAPRQLSKMRDTPRAEFSLPEIAGFGARYILRKAETELELRSGTARHSGIELELIYFIDVEPNLGQPIAQALAPGSEFRSRMATFKPQSTTVTIWIYPDGFDDYRAL